MSYVHKDGDVVPALPELADILSQEFCERLLGELIAIPFENFTESICVKQDVCRVPLTLDGQTVDEEAYLNQSKDGMRHFECLEIHNMNVQSRAGLFKVLKEVQVQLITILYFLCFFTRLLMDSVLVITLEEQNIVYSYVTSRYSG